MPSDRPFNLRHLPRLDRRGVAAIEFAIVAFPFFLLLFFIFEISMDLFEQEALDAGVHLAVRQIQTGNAQNVTNGAAFISSYLCPNVNGLLNCSGLHVKVQKLSLSSGTTVNASGVISGYTDYYNATSGQLPTSNGSLDLSSYSSGSFCNSGPSEYLLVSAIYTAGGIIGNFLPNLLTVSYNGNLVHATLSQVATVTENYPVATAGQGAAAGC